MLDDLLGDRPELPPPVDAAPKWLDTQHGRLCYYSKGQGHTTVLVHSINAAATTYELRTLFEQLSGSRRVIAFDWLGFGLSDRPERRYEPELFTGILCHVLDALAPEGADVVALSLACQYVGVVAARQPERFRHLVFISPTGLGRWARRSTLTNKTAAASLKLPGLGAAVFDGLTNRRAIRRFLGNSFADPRRLQPDHEWYAWATARQRNARCAPLYFVAGLLEDERAPQAFRKLCNPTLMIFGDQARFSDPSAAKALAAWVPNVTVETVGESGDLPHLEQPQATGRLIQGFLER